MYRKTENCIDLVKLFFALCIVAIHTNLLQQFSDNVNWYVTHLVFRLGVPFFFVVSGFFFGKKFLYRQDKLDQCKKYCHRLLPGFTFFGLIGLVVYTARLIISSDQMWLLKVVRHAIFYPPGAMWYVAASMLAVMLIGLLWKRKIALLILAGGGTASPYYAILITS